MDLFYRLWMTTPTDKKPEHRACWQELLEEALSGLRSTDEQVEHMIDRMERGS